MSEETRTPLPERRIMKATAAFHNLGDVSSDLPDWCVVTEEDAENYYGHWVTGLGLMCVRFPKASTHPLSEEEDRQFHERVLPNLRVAGLSAAPMAYGADRVLPAADPIPTDLDAAMDEL